MEGHQYAIRNLGSCATGLTSHARQCNAGIDFTNPKILATFQNRNKASLQYDLFIREGLEIRRQGKGLNDNFGKHVITDAWNPLLSKLK